MKGEKMIFPSSPYEFLLDYSIKDEKEVYTNGALLIPTFRVKQAFEHYFEKQSKWIPVSERLPEKNGKYLVTVRNGNVYAGVYDAFSGRFQCAAIAWMPLPEPYRSESE